MKTLGIDIGSSSIKVSLLDLATGECAASIALPSTEMPIDSPAYLNSAQNPNKY